MELLAPARPKLAMGPQRPVYVNSLANYFIALNCFLANAQFHVRRPLPIVCSRVRLIVIPTRTIIFRYTTSS